MHFRSEKHIPRSLLTQPSITSLMVASSIFPISARTVNTITIINAKAVTFRICSDAVMYWAIHWLVMSANLTDAHTPATSETMAIA